MFYNFIKERLPLDQHDRVKQLIKEFDIEELTYIHNKYRVSDNSFCCPDPCVLIHFDNMFKDE